MEQRQSDKVSFGEEKLVQGPESKSLPSVLLHALQRITVAGLVRVSSSLYHTRCWKLYCGTPAEAPGCYLVLMALEGSVVCHCSVLSAAVTSSAFLSAFLRFRWYVQRLTGLLVHLVNKMTADIRRALWWQERTAKHRYLLRLAAENQKQQKQAELAQKRYCFPLRRA